ncbi:hypothetical protein [Burkholderia glumae]|uniref:hypothetical protein n=1 Tax=Burkholderia glumae TaxID=337 RepID=UPI001F19E7F3|nr:hypothetical protein [Burkholderia glumae]
MIEHAELQPAQRIGIVDAFRQSGAIGLAEQRPAGRCRGTDRGRGVPGGLFARLAGRGADVFGEGAQRLVREQILHVEFQPCALGQ